VGANVGPDEKISGAEMEYYRDIGYESLKAVINALGDTAQRLIMYGLQKALENPKIKAHVKDGIMHYLYVAAFLSFSGREITKESLGSIIKSLDIKPNELFVDMILKADIESHLVYAYAFYLLLASGKSTSEANVMKVIAALGMEPDRTRAAAIRTFISVTKI